MWGEHLLICVLEVLQDRKDILKFLEGPAGFNSWGVL